jgi:hypothetical protein
MNMRITGVVTAAVCTALVMAGSVAKAQESQDGFDFSPQARASAPLLGADGAKGKVSGIYAKNLVLKSTTIGRGYGQIKIPSGLLALDTASTISCPASPKGNCVVEAEIVVQITGTAPNNRYSFCAAINGKSFNPPDGCPYVGLVPANNRYDTRTLSLAQYEVKPGNHKVQSFLGTDRGGTFASVYIKYNVYK